MNAVWNSYGQLCGCPEIFKKSCKFFCRELDIRVTQVVKANFRQAVLSGKPAGAGKRWSDTLSNRLSATVSNSTECTKTKPTDHGFSVLTPAQTVVQL